MTWRVPKHSWLSMGNDSFRFRQFELRQDRCAMKVGTDGTLLGAWALMPGAASGRVLDVGTGTGLIALMMAQRYPEAEVTAIDIDAGAVSQAQENVAASPFARRVMVMEMALQQMGEASPVAAQSSSSLVAQPSSRYDAIVCNPPFFVNSLVCPDARRTAARHASSLPLTDLAAAASVLLSDRGELSVILPADLHSSMDAAAALSGLFAHRVCRFFTSVRKPAKRVLLAYGRQPADAFEQTQLVLGDDNYRQLVAPFYLK